MPLFDEIMMKIARQEKLTPGELESFRQESKALNDAKETVKAWTESGTNRPRLERPILGQPRWIDSPLSPLQVVKTSLTVSNNTTTYITWDTTLSENKGKSFRLNGDKIYLTYPGVNFAYIGTVQWASGATGLRQCGATFYDTGENSLGSLNFHVLDACATESTYVPVADASFGPQFVDLSYVRFYVRHTQGTDLSLTSIRLTFFQI